MKNISVLLQIPEEIEAGLNTGMYERVGGVIRDTEKRRVVAWLRDGTVLDDRIPKRFQLAQAMMPMPNVINFAISSASLLLLLSRLDELSVQMERLSREQRVDFQRDRDVRFKSALQAARDAIEAVNVSTRNQRAHQAIQGLYEAQDNLARDLDDALGKGELISANHYLTRWMYAVISLCRCYLELEELEVAHRRLLAATQLARDYVLTLVEALLGSHPAVYFHPNVPATILRRFIEVFEWLNGRSIIDSIVEKLRDDFWNPDVLGEQSVALGGILKRIRGETPVFWQDKLQTLSNSIIQAEQCIENLRRLEGFDLEIRSMRLMSSSFLEWRALHPEDKGFAVLVLEEPLDIDSI